MAVYSDCVTNTTTFVACNDDGPVGVCPKYGSLTETVQLMAGRSYYVVLGGYSSSTYGSATLTISQVTSSPTQSPTSVGETAAPTRVSLHFRECHGLLNKWWYSIS